MRQTAEFVEYSLIEDFSKIDGTGINKMHYGRKTWGSPAHLTIRNGLDTHVLLELQYVFDGVVLQGF